MKAIYANTPNPPYYAVIFSSIQSNDLTGYEEMAKRMLEQVTKQPGFLGIESARETLGITVSYWKDLKSIKSWKDNSEHIIAQEKGKRKWYQSFKTRIALVEKYYEMM